jgi:hypothetical protein
VWQGVVGGVLVGGAGCPLPCPLLGSGGSVSVGGIFIFDRWHFGGKGNLDGRLE